MTRPQPGPMGKKGVWTVPPGERGNDLSPTHSHGRKEGVTKSCSGSRVACPQPSPGRVGVGGEGPWPGSNKALLGKGGMVQPHR